MITGGTKGEERGEWHARLATDLPEPSRSIPPKTELTLTVRLAAAGNRAGSMPTRELTISRICKGAHVPEKRTRPWHLGSLLPQRGGPTSASVKPKL